MSFEITDQRIDPEALKADLRHETAGACVSFEGWVRDHNDGEPVTALEYEAHASVANKEGLQILTEAVERFDLFAASGRHRVGRLEIGECAVWVGVSAAHRGAAFDACRYIIDQLKQRVPIWKKEYYRDGLSGWINCVTGTPFKARDTTS
ncbi:MAG: molybdenum cofactor biosynthesis protein MoaE [Gammaproteobacteria bacterium]|nr:molybdenum cofactor biosynthesis protein MoaE [Gammaproteobacteria bacterium]MCZ6497942.1 molybdenum cofactor biosynthesis protein MoaE [Gammaproteobacteria bacterium]